jgi:hypothetical protein
MSIIELKKNYPTDIQRQVNLLSIDKDHPENTKLIGSCSYRGALNASDYDLFEKVEERGKNKVVEFFFSKIRQIVAYLAKRKDQYFFELKCGLDPFVKEINIGSLSNGEYLPSDTLLKNSKKLYRMGRMESKDLKKIIWCISSTDDDPQMRFETVQEIYRNIKVLRWNKKEVKQGYKILIDGKYNKYEYDLREAIMDKTECNIEEIFITAKNEFYCSSNFYMIIYVDKDGSEHGVNCDDDILHNYSVVFKENLKRGMYKALYSHISKYNNPLKFFKRLYSYAVFTKNEQMAEVARTVVNGQMGMLYMLAEKLNTLCKIMKNPEKKYIPTVIFRHQMDDVQWTIQGTTMLPINVYNEVLRDLFGLLKLSNEKLQRNIKNGKITKIFEKNIKNIKDFVRVKVMEQIQSLGYFPLPSYLMPITPPF